LFRQSPRLRLEQKKKKNKSLELVVWLLLTIHKTSSYLPSAASAQLIAPVFKIYVSFFNYQTVRTETVVGVSSGLGINLKRVAESVTVPVDWWLKVKGRGGAVASLSDPRPN
jgi:hypothetical protein